MQTDTEIDIDIIDAGEGDGGVAHGATLLAFVDAAMNVDPKQTAEAREQLVNAIGESGVVDAAAVTAMFQLNTRAADAAGIPIEEATLANRDEIGVQLGFASRIDGVAP